MRTPLAITSPHSQPSYHLIQALSLISPLVLSMACESRLQQRLRPPSATYTSLSASGEEIRHAIQLPSHSASRHQPPQPITAHGANATASAPLPKPLRGARPCAPNTAWFSGQCTELQRFYIWQRTTTGSHHITTTPPPHTTPGYTYSGRSFVAMLPAHPHRIDGAYPVYALTSPGDEQYLTRSPPEQANLTRHHGYSQGTILFYVAAGKSFGSQKIYRYKHPSSAATAQPYHGPWQYSFGQTTDPTITFDGSLGWVLSATLDP